MICRATVRSPFATIFFCRECAVGWVGRWCAPLPQKPKSSFKQRAASLFSRIAFPLSLSSMPSNFYTSPFLLLSSVPHPSPFLPCLLPFSFPLFCYCPLSHILLPFFHAFYLFHFPFFVTVLCPTSFYLFHFPFFVTILCPTAFSLSFMPSTFFISPFLLLSSVPHLLRALLLLFSIFQNVVLSLALIVLIVLFNLETHSPPAFFILSFCLLLVTESIFYRYFLHFLFFSAPLLLTFRVFRLALFLLLLAFL